MTLGHTALAPDWPGKEYQVTLVEHYTPLLTDAIESLFDPLALAVALIDDPSLIDGLKLDMTALVEVVSELYGDSYLAGYHASDKTLDKQGISVVQPPWVVVPVQAALADDPVVNWTDWVPGHDAAAALVAANTEGAGLGGMLTDAGIWIKGMGDSTVNEISGLLSDALARGAGAPELGRELRGLVDGDKARALTIAQTEMARAMTVASLDSYVANGVEAKVWLLSDGACELCQENESDGVIALEDEFSNGDPPVHPNCVCAIGPARMEDVGDGGWTQLSDDEVRARVLGDSSGDSLDALGLSKQQKSAIKAYSNKSAGPINKYLRGEVPTITDRNATVLERLNSAFETAGKTDERVVYRGLTIYDPEVRTALLDSLNESTTITLDGFQSTSLSPGVGQAFASHGGPNGVLFEIYTNQGIDITSLAWQQSEYEVLLQGGRFRVVGVVEKGIDYVDAAGNVSRTRLPVVQLRQL